MITLTTGDGDQSSAVLVYSGQPIGQPVAMGGPFVMNTKTEITQAFNDFPLRQVRRHPQAGPPEVPLTGANGAGSKAV